MKLPTSVSVLALAVACGCGSVNVPEEDTGSEADGAPDVTETPDTPGDVPDVAPDVPDVVPDVPDVAPDVVPDVPEVLPDVTPDDADVHDAEDHAPDDAEPSVCPDGMVFIPSGPFAMGSDSGEGQADEQPEHNVELSAYCIDATEVTVRQYRACQTAGVCSLPSGAYAADENPVAFVLWEQAMAFCSWAGKRLPTEAEWEKAARGGCEMVSPAICGPEDERTYPWGEAIPTCDLASYGGCGGGSQPVGTHPSGDSPYGVHDLAGNLWEWVGDFYDPNYYSTCPTGSCTDPTGPSSGMHRVIRGGSWFDPVNALRAAFRDPGVPNAGGYATFGFRCAKRP